MPFLHPNNRLKVATLDGWSDFIQLEPLAFRTRAGRLLQAVYGATTDGLSGPKFAKCDLQSSNSFFPAVAHDAAYRGNLAESLDNGVTWTPVVMTKAEADALLLELCMDNGVPPFESQIIFDAVVEFGAAAWAADAPLRNRPNAGTKTKN